MFVCSTKNDSRSELWNNTHIHKYRNHRSMRTEGRLSYTAETQSEVCIYTTHRIRRRSLHSEGDQIHPSEEHQSQAPLLLSLRPLVLWLDLSELLTVGQYKVHVPVKSQEGTDEHAAIQKGDPHAVLHVLTHLPFTRLQGGN